MNFSHRGRGTVFALLACCVAASVACAREGNKNLDRVRVVLRGSLINAAMYVGEEEGDFAREGIRLDYTASPASSTQAFPLLEREAVDVLAGAPSAGFYAAVALGARSKMVADRGHVEPAAGCEFNGIVGRRDAFSSESPTASQVRGKVFSINSPGSAAFLTDKYLESVGLAAADVRTAKLAQTLEAQALATGALDVTHAQEPYVSAMKAEGHYLLAGARRLAPGMHIGSLYFGPSLTVRNRELGHRFMRAYLRGARRLAEGPTPRNVDILARRTGFDPAALRTHCLPSISVTGSLNLPWLLEFQQWAVKRGYLDKVGGIDAGLDTMFTHDAVLAIGPAEKQ